MANLETLELTISANAQSATQGVGQLIRSLSYLDTAVGKSIAGLKKLNAELKELKGYGALKLPNLSKSSGASAARNAAKEYIPKGVNVDAVNRGDPNAKSQAQWQKEYDENVKKSLADHQERIRRNNEYRERLKAEAEAAKEKVKQEQAAQKELARLAKEEFNAKVANEREAMQKRGEDTKAIIEQSTQVDLLKLKYDALKMETVSLAKEGKLTAKQIAERSIQLQKLDTQVKKLSQSTEQMKKTAKEAGESSSKGLSKIGESVGKVKHSASSLLSTIGRIFKTMMIRTAIRAMLKAAKEGLDNYYQYSKKMNLSFGSDMDNVANKWARFKNQIGATLGNALQSILPVAHAVLSVLNAIAEAATMLFALLSGKSTYSKAKDGMDGYAASVKGAGSAVKNTLADFDELNVIMSKGGGGGGGSAAKDFANMFEEVELPAWMLEWKPIIEAVLAGVLGSIILPKIWEWIKKIFGLFTGKETVMDFLTKLIDKKSKLPDMSKQAVDMVAFGGGAAAAAAALPIVSAQIEKIVAALKGVSLLESLAGLIASLLTKAFSAIPIKVTLNKKEYDDFKKEHEKWIKDADEKKVTFVIDGFDDKELEINGWIDANGTKLIDVKIEDDVAKITQLNNWIATEDTKTIHIKIDDDVEKITQLVNWTATDGTKEIKITINDDVAKITQLNNWVATADDKYINLKFVDNAMVYQHLVDWLAVEDTKTINLKFKMAEDGKGKTGEGGSAEDFLKQKLFKPFWQVKDSDPWWQQPIWKWFGDGKNTNGLNYEITISITEASIEAVKTQIESIKPTITIKAEIQYVMPENVGLSGTNHYTLPGQHANGAYGIPNGDLFIANEKGAELVGSMNGKTTVANQGQIIEGISNGVRNANAEQNTLLRRQNELLVSILEKSGNISVEPSASWGRFNQRSAEMWSMATGR